MLAVPEVEVAKSSTQHNSKLEVIADWIEVSCLSEGGRQSYASAVDVLRDQNIYDSDDFAWRLIDLVIDEFSRRARAIGQGYPFIVDTKGLTLTRQADESADYAFCLLASIGPAYQAFRAAAYAGSGRSRRGRLFEELALDCLAAVLPWWDVELTGWHSSSAARLPALAESVSVSLGVPVNGYGLSVHKHRKDAGLDVLCMHRNQDGRGHRPSIFLACASGPTDWRRKRKEPDLEVWNAVLNLSSKPMPGFAVPFALSAAEFEETACLNKGVVMDRLRLLARPTPDRAWLQEGTRAKLSQWVGDFLPFVPEA